MNGASVIRTPHRLHPDPRRVIAKPYLPGEEIFPDGKSRVKLVLERILAIPDAEVAPIVEGVLASFAGRHRDFEQVLGHHFQLIAHNLGGGESLPHDRRLLIGAYFTHEYSFEAAALFNPSIVPAVDQSGIEPGSCRFVMSIRAVGEGHISSIEFRGGVIDRGGEVTLDPPAACATTGHRKPPLYDKLLFTAKLAEIGADNQISSQIIDPLPEQFRLDELETQLACFDQRQVSLAMSYETIKMIHWLASSNYTLVFAKSSAVSERVLFPLGPTESKGLEDARFVRFREDDGSVVYYATYTAFDGFEILPQLIETRDFLSFRIATLNGRCAQNKGMAIFPRRIGGEYVMLSRWDRENIHIMTSDNIRRWNHTELLRTPQRAWELIQIGNCGSPLETDAGWLVLTHGVGPMRRYTIGAMLLDRDDPARVLAYLPDPLLTPDEDEREGYVPNVVYSCGGMIHGEHLVLPYGFADQGTGIALVRVEELLGRMV